MKTNPRTWVLSFLALCCTTLTAFLPAVAGLLPQGDTSKEYCNVRYDFCLEYPDYIFTKSDVSPNGDGIILTSKDENTQLRASGYYNVMELPVTSEYEDFLEVIKLDNEGMTIRELEKRFSDNEFECLIEAGNQLYYQKTELYGHDFVSLSLIINQKNYWEKAENRQVFEELKDLIRLNVGS